MSTTAPVQTASIPSSGPAVQRAEGEEDEVQGTFVQREGEDEEETSA